MWFLVTGKSPECNSQINLAALRYLHSEEKMEKSPPLSQGAKNSFSLFKKIVGEGKEIPSP